LTVYREDLGLALADDIRALRARALAELTAAHDYYTDTKMAWQVIHKVIRAGHKFTIRNMTTGTVTQEAQLAAKARGYVAEYLAEATFQQFVSVFENFFFDLLRLWLKAYPQSLGDKELRFKNVLEAADKEAVTLYIVDKEINEIAYDRPKEWFSYLEARTRLGCPSAAEIERIGEAKASRDILAHNRGIANKTYESKAGRAARYRDGQRVEIPEPYHCQTWELIRKVITDLSDAAATKFV
jgi:hypothetical protein